MADYKKLCAELVQQLDDALDFTVSGETRRYMKELVGRTRTALAQPAPPAEGDVGELVAFLRGCADGHYGHGKRGRLMLTRAADLLEQHHPTPVPVVYAPTDEELLELADDSDMDRLEGERGYPDGTVIKEGCWEAWDHQLLAFARAVLAKYGTTPVPTPVPVSERPWERDGWCDESGRCWAWSPARKCWHLMDPRIAVDWIQLLPFDAIPSLGPGDKTGGEK